MIGELLAAVCSDRDVLANIAGPIGIAARVAADQFMGLNDKRRVQSLIALRAPVGPGLRGVDPSWIEAGLQGLPAEARDVVAGVVAGGDPNEVWLARSACAEIPPLPKLPMIPITIPCSISEAVRMRGDALWQWLEDVGADQLACALRPAGAAAVKSTAAIVGDRLVRAAIRVGRPPRDGVLGPIRASIARCRVELDNRTLARIGARTLAPYCDPLARRQLMVRLPRHRGLAVGAELRAYADTAIDQSPTWLALAAPC